MKVTAVITIDFDVDRFEDGDPSVEVVRSVVIEVAQAVRHQTSASGVAIGAVNATLIDPSRSVIARLDVTT